MQSTVAPLPDADAITPTRAHAFPMKTLAWWTLAITAVMGVLYFLVSAPPDFSTYYGKMYFHAIGIGLAALAAYLLVDVFDLETHEPPLDFPIRYRAFIAVVFGALGGVVYLNRDVSAALPDIGLGLFLVAFLFIFDVGAAILVELIVLPRKQAGIYDSRSRTIVDYVGRLIPFTAADRAAYAGQRAGYWLRGRLDGVGVRGHGHRVHQPVGAGLRTIDLRRLHRLARPRCRGLPGRDPSTRTGT